MDSTLIREIESRQVQLTIATDPTVRAQLFAEIDRLQKRTEAPVAAPASINDNNKPSSSSSVYRLRVTTSDGRAWTIVVALQPRGLQDESSSRRTGTAALMSWTEPALKLGDPACVELMAQMRLARSRWFEKTSHAG
jgi:hypothetical protein